MKRKIRVGFTVLTIYNVIIYLIILAPIVAVLLASISPSEAPVFPPNGFTLKWYLYAIGNSLYMGAFGISLVLGILTALSATALGTLSALALVRYRFVGRDVLQAFFLSPLILPLVLIGVALLQFYSLVGIRASIFTLLVGHIIITAPYVVRLVSVGLAGFDRNLELAARNLGASAWETFRRITLPIIMTGVVAGAAFAFIVSFGDVTLTVFITSPKVVTLPVRIFAYLEIRYDTFIFALGSMMIVFAAIAMVIIERAVGLGRVFGIEPRGR
ncbi:MAG: ABC transporter permease [Chloroflexi bacterium]|nr:ABC transporter permease [Chloroflexota bacterium]